MKPIYTFLCAVLLTIASQAAGQNMSTSLTAVSSPPYPVGSQVIINLNATNFTNVSSILLPITYNSAVLRFDSIDTPTLPEYIDTTLLFHPNPGVIKIAWFPSLINYPNGASIAGPNGRLMTLRFTVIGNGTTTVNLSTTVPFTPIEVINATGNVIFNNSIFQTGGSSSNGVSVMGGMAPPLVGFKIIGTDVYAKQGHRVCVPVSVNDFDNMQLLQYAMHWDNTKLTYDCVRGAVNPIVPTFNPPAQAPGTLLLQWEDPNLLSGMGVTKPDGARIYEVCFNTIGAPGTQSSITFDGFGFGFPPDFTNQFAEAANNLGNNVWTTGGPNGASGVGSTVYIMNNPPGGFPVTYTLDKDTIAPSGMTCVDLKVKNFSLITESEFQLTYDATKLSLITPVTIPATSLGLVAGNIVPTVSGTTGIVKFKWALPAGATVPDNTTIFSLCFTATGGAGTLVPITFGTAPCPAVTPYSTHKKDSGGQPYQFVDGQVNIMAQNGPPVLTPTPTFCNTGNTGAISVNPMGTATAYSWSPGGATTQNLSNVAPGIYTVTVTYGANGTATGSATVTAPAAISMTQTAVGVTCNGDSNGSVDITPTGGTAPFTYLWNGPMGFTATTQDLTGVKTGNYVVTITDSKSCVFTSAAVNVPTPQPMAVGNSSVVITTVSCFGGNNGAISITPTGGTSPYTYDWSNDGPEDPDNDPQNVVGLIAGTYTVTITDTRGCTFAPQPYVVSQNAKLETNLVKKVDVKCFGTATGEIEVAVIGGSGNKTYSWRLMPANTQVSTDPHPTNLAPGFYNVVVTDGSSCTSMMTSNVEIKNPNALIDFIGTTTTPGLCFGEPTGSISLVVNGGWGGNGFQWSSGLPGIQNHTAVSSGTYTVTVTDQVGCTATSTVSVGGAQSAISIGTPAVNNVTCFGQGNGGICLTLTGGNGGPYTVQWSNTTLMGACIGNLADNMYAPTVTDGQNCTAVFANIPVNAPQELMVSGTTVMANPTGAINLTVTGGTPNYSYSWSNGASTKDLTGMPAGTYTVIVTDANDCSKTGTYEIVASNVLIGATATPTPSCNNDGCINVTIPNTALGAGPYTLSWAGGSMPATPSLTPSACGLAAGPYVVTITASNGNTVTVSATINQLQQALISTSTIINPIDDQHNGSITVQSTFPNCTFLWNNGSTQQSLSSLDSGLYVVTVTNNTSGCTSVYSYSLARQYNNFVFTIQGATNPTCATSSNGSIVIKVEGGDGPNYTYKWSGPNGFSASTKDILNLKPGFYTVTVTQENGTTTTHGPIQLSPQSTLGISNVLETSTTPGGTQVSGANTCDGVAEVLFSGAVGNSSILWNNGITTAINATICGPNYSVTVTDGLGCSSVWSDALTVPAAIGVTSIPTSPKCTGEINGSARVKVSGGIEPYKVVWSNGQSDPIVFANGFSEAISLASGTYTVTITDKNFVTSTQTVIVLPAPQIEVSFTGVDPNSFNACDGERIAFVSGATNPIEYTWAGSYGHNGDTERAEGLCSGEILYYDITDANGCSVSVIDTVPYPEDGCFLVRPVLTPAEQDGNNDFTLITCIESVPNTVEIYNRWGQLVFQTAGYTNNMSDPANTWTGFTRSGQALPEGVYYYVLTFIDDESNQHQLKGHINLLK